MDRHYVFTQTSVLFFTLIVCVYYQSYAGIAVSLLAFVLAVAALIPDMNMYKKVYK